MAAEEADVNVEDVIARALLDRESTDDLNKVRVRTKELDMYRNMLTDGNLKGLGYSMYYDP